MVYHIKTKKCIAIIHIVVVNGNTYQLLIWQTANGLNVHYSLTYTHSQHLNNARNHSVLTQNCTVPSLATRGLVTASNGCSGMRGGREGLGIYVATGQSSSCGPSCDTLEWETTSTTSDRGACQHVQLCRTWALLYTSCRS